MFKLLFTLLDQEIPPKPRKVKPWENPGLHEKRKKPSGMLGALCLTYFSYDEFDHFFINRTIR
jgi:hypothetical protein